MPLVPAKVPRNFLLPGWVLIVLFIAYALPGNVLHAPWRGDDVLTIDIAAAMLKHGNWLVPSLAGQPYLEWPPLAHWLGASLGLLLGWLLPVYDAIRLASVLSLAIMLWTLRQAALRLYGEEAAQAAILISLGSLGLLVHAHEAQPMMLLGACVCATLFGLVLSRDEPVRGAVVAGISAGAAFLTAGLAGAFLTLPLWLLMPALCVECRQTRTSHAWLLALAIACVLAAIWPLALALSAPAVLREWWSSEWRDILPSVDHLQRVEQLSGLLAWFAWPLWPVAAWGVWRQRKQLRDFKLLLPAASLLLAAWLIATTGSIRNANALPILPPLILLASSEWPKLRRGASNFLDWFGVMTFSLLIVFLWLAFSAVHLGWPSGLSRNIARLAEGYTMPFSTGGMLIGILLTLGWVVAIVRMPFFQLRSAVHWALGVTLAWGITSVLWQPWFDYTKNYQPVVSRIAREMHELGAPRNCLSVLGGGAAQQAALDYFAGIHARSTEDEAPTCPVLLAYGAGRDHVVPRPGEGWEALWTIHLGRGRSAESFVFYRRLP